MTLQAWTIPGIARLDAEIAGLSKKLIELHEGHSVGCNCKHDEQQEAGHLANSETGIYRTRLADRKNLRNKVKEAVPVDTDQIQVGSTVTIEHLVDAGKYKAGDTERMIQGGPEESDTTSEPHTISSTSPRGRALMGKRKGDEVSYRAPNGTFEILITEIEQPALLSESIANAA